LEKYPLRQLAGGLPYFTPRSGAAVGGAIRLSTVMVHDRTRPHSAGAYETGYSLAVSIMPKKIYYFYKDHIDATVGGVTCQNPNR
jgi:hypothetical protein